MMRFAAAHGKQAGLLCGIVSWLAGFLSLQPGVCCAGAGVVTMRDFQYRAIA
jgi:hypothetical protein